MSGTAEAFLAAATSEARPIIDDPILLVVAHPDDETLACGALLPRLRNLTILHVTDGSPRDGSDAARLGFATGADYAAARRDELARALALAGVGADRLACLDVPDGGVASRLPALASRLVPFLERAAIVLTHAVEGGHPDHDATGWAVWAACCLLEDAAPIVVFLPLYRADPEGPGWLRQSPEPGDASLRLSEAERERKRAMLACFATQADTLQQFGAADEAFRPMTAPDLTYPASRGRALYDSYGWGVDSTTFARLADEALSELGLR